MKKFSEDYLNHLFEKEGPKVKIPIERGDLGLSLDAPIEDYKDQLKKGKDWDEMSQQIKTLAIFNKNKHPEISKKADLLRDKLASWVEKERESNPDFAK